MPLKAILFDFMGTCLDWHFSVTAALPMNIPEEHRSQLALDWRQAYFDSNAARLAQGLSPEDIDITLQRTLIETIATEKYSAFRERISYQADVASLIAAWHSQPAWPDVLPALKALKQQGYELFVHANGTTRLQLDLINSSGLTEFDMPFSSELLGVYKPAPENYLKCLHLLKIKPEEALTVAAHAYDLRGAKAVGMKTVYIYRWTDDVLEDQELVKQENDAYLMDMQKLPQTIAELAS